MGSQWCQKLIETSRRVIKGKIFEKNGLWNVSIYMHGLCIKTNKIFRFDFYMLNIAFRICSKLAW